MAKNTEIFEKDVLKEDERYRSQIVDTYIAENPEQDFFARYFGRPPEPSQKNKQTTSKEQSKDLRDELLNPQQTSSAPGRLGLKTRACDLITNLGTALKRGIQQCR